MSEDNQKTEVEIKDATIKELQAEKTKAEEERNRFSKEIREISLKRDEYKEKLKQFEDAESLKKGEYEKLITEKSGELESVKSKLAEAEKTVNEYREYQNKKRASLLDELTDKELKEIGESLPLDKLEVFVKKQITAKVPDTDGGKVGDRSVTPLTDAEKKEAQELGLKEADYREVMEYRKSKSKT